MGYVRDKASFPTRPDVNGMSRSDHCTVKIGCLGALPLSPPPPPPSCDFTTVDLDEGLDDILSPCDLHVLHGRSFKETSCQTDPWMPSLPLGGASSVSDTLAASFGGGASPCLPSVDANFFTADGSNQLSDNPIASCGGASSLVCQSAMSSGAPDSRCNIYLDSLIPVDGQNAQSVQKAAEGSAKKMPAVVQADAKEVAHDTLSFAAPRGSPSLHQSGGDLETKIAELERSLEVLNARAGLTSDSCERLDKEVRQLSSSVPTSITSAISKTVGHDFLESLNSNTSELVSKVASTLDRKIDKVRKRVDHIELKVAEISASKAGVDSEYSGAADFPDSASNLVCKNNYQHADSGGRGSPDSPSVSEVTCVPHPDASSSNFETVGFPDSQVVSEVAYGPRLVPSSKISRDMFGDCCDLANDSDEQLGLSPAGGCRSPPPLTKLPVSICTMGSQDQRHTPAVGIALKDASLGFLHDKAVASVRAVSRHSMLVAHTFIALTLVPRGSDPQSYAYLSQLVHTYMNTHACPLDDGLFSLALSMAPWVCQQSSASACSHASLYSSVNSSQDL